MPMNDFLRERIIRKLDALPDERGYQILDYLEFLESKYAERTSQTPNIFQRFAEGVEDTMRAGRISANTIGETMGLLNKAMSVLNGAAAAGKSVASDVVSAVSRPASAPTPTHAPAPSTPPIAPVPPTPPTPPTAPASTVDMAPPATQFTPPPAPPPPTPQAPQGEPVA